MQPKDTEKEIKYQMIKVVALNLKMEGLISNDEARGIINKAKNKIRTIAGRLDDVKEICNEN